MKTNKLFLMGLLAVGLTACTSDNDFDNGKGSEGQDGGTTYAGLTISLKAPGTRAPGDPGLTDAQADNVGRAKENQINSIKMLSNTVSKVWDTKKATATDATAEKDFWAFSDSEYRVKAFLTTPGLQKLGLMLNSGSIDKVLAGASDKLLDKLSVQTTTFGPATDGAAVTADKIIDMIAKLSTDGESTNTTGFVMTSATAGKMIAENIKEDDCNNGTTETENVFEFNCERLVSQGIVVKGTSIPAQTTANSHSKVSVDLNNLTYSAMNGATEMYLFADKAGSRTLSTTTYKYDGFESALHNWKAALHTDATNNFESARDQSDVTTAKLIRLGTLKPIVIDNAWMTTNDDATKRAAARDTENAKLVGYAARPVLANGDVQAYNSTNTPLTSDANKGIFFMENSAKKEAYTKENLDHGFWRLATAKVYATVTPVKIWGLKFEQDGTTDNIKLTDKREVIEYTVAASKTDYDAMPETSAAEKIAKAHTYCPGTTFYKGHVDGYLYAQAEAAMRSNGQAQVHLDSDSLDLSLADTDPKYATNGLPIAYKYDMYLDARCGWRALWNRQTGTEGDDIYKKVAIEGANTRRNNIYLLEIAAFDDLGFPFDSCDPFDPNLPKPLPEYPTAMSDDPDDPDVEREKTYMRVVGKVLPWNVAKRQATFY